MAQAPKHHPHPLPLTPPPRPSPSLHKQVVIINGEVVPDNDPRAVKHRGGFAPSSSGAGVQQRRGPATIHGDAAAAAASNDTSSAFQGKTYTASGKVVPPPAAPQSSASADGAAGGPRYYPSPPLLQQAAEALGTQGRTVTIPAVPFLDLTGSTFDLLPCLCLVAALLYFGWRGVVGVVALYVLVKRSQDVAPRADMAARRARREEQLAGRAAR